MDKRRTSAPETLMMGLGYDPRLSEGAVKPPLFQCSTFVFESPEHGKRFFELAYGLRERELDESIGLIYSRINNPNLEILEDRLAVWDTAEKALSFSSGMAAIATTVLSFCRPGERIAYTMPTYGGTEYLFKRILPRFGIEAVPVPISHPTVSLAERISRLRGQHGGRRSRLAMVYCETPANPTNQLVDLYDLASLKPSFGPEEPPLFVVDNTFLGPVWQKPLQHGFDVVLYSLTKYVGGHSDLVAGAAMGSEELMTRIGEFRTILGTATDPHTAWLLLRSLETLKLRIEQSARNATSVAAYLHSHPSVKEVLYPSPEYLCTNQQEIFSKQCTGSGSTLSVRLIGARAEAYDFLRNLQLVKLAVSLGGTESLASHPATMTHSDYSPADKRRYGISDNLVRLSIGIENADDLIADLNSALNRTYCRAS